ncbi:hypothetical protein BH10BAC2_BH10BAC2_00150 [soil metagenome]
MPRLFILIIVLIILSCNRDSKPEELIDRFYANQIYFDSLVTILQADRHLDSLFMIGPERGIPDIEITYPEVYLLIKKIGITDASSHVRICRKCPPWYYLKTNWSSGYTIYLSYNCKEINGDSTEDMKGFY